MKITNTNIRPTFWITFGALLLISVMDFVLNRIAGAVSEWFWGYIFIVNIVLVALVYILFGKPIFRYNEKGDFLEITSGLSIGRWFEEKILVNRGNLVKFSFEKKGLRSYLILNILYQSGVKSFKFPISFLSTGKREKLKKHLQEITGEGQESKDIQMFI